MKFISAVAALALVKAQENCECLGYDNLPTELFVGSGFTDQYGSSCESWDAGQNPDCAPGAEYEDEDWCSSDFKWCYVDEACIYGQHTIYYVDAKLYWKDCARDDILAEREAANDCGDASSATKMVATFATAFAAASLAM